MFRMIRHCMLGTITSSQRNLDHFILYRFFHAFDRARIVTLNVSDNSISTGSSSFGE